jgi:hypothetical protein
VAAVGAGADDALFLGKAGEEDVEEAAEGEAEQGGEDGSDELEWIQNFDFAPYGFSASIN